MNIQIDGTGMINKGAELMLYAILDQIEKRYPDSSIIYNGEGKCSYIETPLKLRKRFFKKLNESLYTFRLPGILRRLHLPYSFLTNKYASSKVDIVLDAGGYQFSDKFQTREVAYLQYREYYSKLKKKGIKIILLPQAYGPFDSNIGRKTALLIDEYIDLIFVRDKISYNHLCKAGVKNEKLLLFPDFTAAIKGKFISKYNYLKDAVCLIPNARMLDKTSITYSEYIGFFCAIISLLEDKKQDVFLLNHEGEDDLKLCSDISSNCKSGVKIISGLNALQVKGIISNSCIVISSRYHGVASALSSGVPCLATSWSHKYKELFEDFNQKDTILDVLDIEDAKDKIISILNPINFAKIKNELSNSLTFVLQKNLEMWNVVWNYINNKD